MLNVTLRPGATGQRRCRAQRSNLYETWGGNLVNDARIVRLRGTYQLTRGIGARVIGEFSDQFNSLATAAVERQVAATARVCS